MLAKHALYQLSYGPKGTQASESYVLQMISSASAASVMPPRACGVVGPGGLEPPTSRLSGVCSNQLSYRPELERGALAIAFQPKTGRREARFARQASRIQRAIALAAGMSVERETETAAFRTCLGVFERPNSVVRPGGTSLERR